MILLSLLLSQNKNHYTSKQEAPGEADLEAYPRTAKNGRYNRILFMLLGYDSERHR